jgi:glucan endo-1,6-beta-glucosidase
MSYLIVLTFLLEKWADAQKIAYSKGAGWIYWNFKTEEFDASGNELARQWSAAQLSDGRDTLTDFVCRSYEEALVRGYMLWDPAAVHNASVCEPYVTIS